MDVEDGAGWTWEVELYRALAEIAALEAEIESLREYAEFCRLAMNEGVRRSDQDPD